MYRRKVVAKNTIFLGFSELISRASKFALLVLAARLLGVNGFGEFNYAFAFVALFVILADFGLPSLATREFSRGDLVVKDVPSLFSLKLLLGLISFSFIIIGSFLISKEPGIRYTILFLSAFMGLNSLMEIIFALYRAKQQMIWEAGWKILQATSVIIVGFLLLTKSPSPTNLSLSYAIASITTTIVALVIFHYKVQNLFFVWRPKAWLELIKMSWPLAVTAIAVSVYNYTDSVMLGIFGYVKEVGWYNASYKIINLATLPMILVAQSYYSPLSKAYKESKKLLQEIWNDYFILAVSFAIPLTAGGVLLSKDIISLLYGSNYYPAVTTLVILLPAASGIIIMGTFSHGLIVSNQHKKNFIVSIVGAVINIVLNMALIPMYKQYGASIATLATIFTMASIYLFFLQKYSPIRPFNRKTVLAVTISILCSLIMYLSLPYTDWIGQTFIPKAIVKIFFGSSIYIACYYFIYKLVWKNSLFQTSQE